MNGTKTTRGNIRYCEHTRGNPKHDDCLYHIRPKRSPETTGRAIREYCQGRDNNSDVHVEVEKDIERFCSRRELCCSVRTNKNDNKQAGKLSYRNTAPTRNSGTEKLWYRAAVTITSHTIKLFGKKLQKTKSPRNQASAMITPDSPMV